MDIPRDLIIDLLPSYLADEVSETTRMFVERFLQQDVELQKLIEKRFQLDDDVVPALHKDHELNSFARTKRLMNQQSLLMAVAFFLTLLPMSITGGSDGISWAWAGQPIVAVLSLVAASVLWLVYLLITRRLSQLD